MQNYLFSNYDSSLPDINLKKAPKIKKRLPKLQELSSRKSNINEILFDLCEIDLNFNTTLNNSFNVA